MPHTATNFVFRARQNDIGWVRIKQQNADGFIANLSALYVIADSGVVMADIVFFPFRPMNEGGAVSMATQEELINRLTNLVARLDEKVSLLSEARRQLSNTPSVISVKP